MSEVRTIDISDKSLNIASHALLSGGTVIIPTHRWYMVCTKATNNKSIERIFEAKQRPLSKQPLFILPEKNLTEHYFKSTKEADKLIKNLWAGDLSLILLWANKKISSQFCSINQEYVLTNNPPGFFGELAKLTNEPLAATTVNISGTIYENKLGPAISVDEVHNFLQITKLEVDVVIDGGISQAFNHSTILDCRDPLKTLMVREGYVHKRAINVALGYELFNL